MKILNYVMIVLFAYSAYVQLNDPDPIAWVLVYLGAMAFCGLWIIDEFPRTLGFVFAGASLFTGMLLLVRALIRGVWYWDEAMNEAVGLLIVFVWVSSLAWLEWRKEGNAPLT